MMFCFMGAAKNEGPLFGSPKNPYMVMVSSLLCKTGSLPQSLPNNGFL